MLTHISDIVETEALERRFGDLVAVDGLTMNVPAGGVIGLVGPNGSGKSTLIRMLLGLIRPSGGSARVLGQPIADPRRYAARLGALVENPAFVPGLSAQSNLRSLARLRGLRSSRVQEVIDAVGLTGRDTEPVKRFSLGMKQRLGIAAALLPDPELLILDEPTNGLDPAGIVEIRTLLNSLGTQGRTVIVSSHLLAELEAICTYLVIIRFGVLLYSGSIADLLQRKRSRVAARPEFSEDAPRLQQTLTAAGWSVTHDAQTGVLSIDVDTDRAAAQINRAAAAAGFTLESLSIKRDSLESVFLDLTGRDDAELAAGRAASGPARPSKGSDVQVGRS